MFLSSILWAGFNLAAFNLPIAGSPRGRRTIYLAIFAVVTGGAFFVASLAGGIVAESVSDLHRQIGPQTVVNYHVLFVLSSLMRLVAAAVMFGMHEPHDLRMPVMMHFMGYTALKYLSLGRQIFPTPPRRVEEEGRNSGATAR